MPSGNLGAQEDRFTRQSELVPRDRLADLSVAVIGVGAIGRQVALQLAALGVTRMQLIDHDTVEHTNRTTQGYLIGDVGEAKVTATARAIAAIDPEISVEAIAECYRPKLVTAPVVFCCVDSIATRAAIWRREQVRSEFWCDGRMRGEVLRVLTATDERGRKQYGQSLFAAHEAQRGSCGTAGTLYTASIAAGLMVAGFVRWLRGQGVEGDVSLNLLAGELVVGV